MGGFGFYTALLLSIYLKFSWFPVGRGDKPLRFGLVWVYATSESVYPSILASGSGPVRPFWEDSLDLVANPVVSARFRVLPPFWLKIRVFGPFWGYLGCFGSKLGVFG